MNDESRVVADIAQWIHSGLQKSLSDSSASFAARRMRGLQFRVFSTLRKQMLRWNDPVVRHDLPDQRSVLLHLSHNYPYHKLHNRYYDTSLGRLASFIEAQKGTLEMVDVGANVGDTLWQFPAKSHGRFLCIEGDDKYYPLLEQNTGKEAFSVLCVKAICDETEREVGVTFVQDGGSSYVSESAAANKHHHQTLDQIVGASDFRPNLVKIDTDGYDYKVLRGARELIRKHQPAIFFELSPKHLVQAGEDPLAIFSMLVELGYKQVFFYDNSGFPVVKVPTAPVAQVAQLLTYASSRPAFYFDALLFPDSDAALFDAFVSAEISYFGEDAAKRTWPR